MKYLARIEPIAQQPNGDTDEEGGYLIDAVPVAELERRGRQNALLSGQAPMPFLALTSRRPFAGASEEGWFQIQVADDSARGDAIEAEVAFGSQGAQGAPRRFSVSLDGEVASDGLVQVFEQASRFEEVPDAEVGRVQSLLGQAQFFHEAERLAIGVYDVGQASMSAIVDGNEHPLIFFDLGWPLSFNARSFSRNDRFDPLRDFGNPRAPVVLSHLDWDHWGYAVKRGFTKRDKSTGAWTTTPEYRPEAIERTWLLTRPRAKRHGLGPSHLHFVETLRSTGELLFWPEQSSAISSGAIVIARTSQTHAVSCKPSYLRNNEALCMRVELGASNALLCGDADYPSIPEVLRECLSAIVAPHHGGRVTKGSTPRALGHGRMVVSTFDGCYPSIPCDEAMREAFGNGWRAAHTDDRYMCGRCRQSHGNRLIRFAHTPMCGCGNVERAGLCISRT